MIRLRPALGTLTATLACLLPAAPALAAPVVANGIAGTNGATVPELEWDACPSGSDEEAAVLEELGYECTTADVPLSYRDPDGERIELALGRLPAGDPENRIGTLFWNPGGPGGSGRLPFPITEELHERFDIVGFDPRGIAGSTPIQCFASNAQAARLLGWEFPITDAQERRVTRLSRRATDVCARNGGPLLEHASTANVARDMDLLRQAVGAEEMNFVGYSYGTHVGEAYANLFPDEVGAVALDAVIDPFEWTTGRTPEQALLPSEIRIESYLGARDALSSFLAECAADERCAFREEGRDLRAKYDLLLARLRAAPLELVDPETQEPFEVTYQTVTYITLGGLYSASSSSLLAEILQELTLATGQRTARAARRVPRAVRRALADPPRPTLQQPDETPEEAPYAGYEQGLAVICVDTNNPRDPLVWPGFGEAADRVGAPFGRLWVWGTVPCATWPSADADRYTGPWNRETAPILLVGNSAGDPATPYEDAVSTSQELGNARLLTLDTFGHTAIGGPSTCIDDYVNRYFIDGDLPPEGTVCQPDRRPFDPFPEEEGEGEGEEGDPVPDDPAVLPELRRAALGR